MYLKRSSLLGRMACFTGSVRTAESFAERTAYRQAAIDAAAQNEGNLMSQEFKRPSSLAFLTFIS